MEDLDEFDEDDLKGEEVEVDHRKKPDCPTHGLPREQAWKISLTYLNDKNAALLQQRRRKRNAELATWPVFFLRRSNVSLIGLKGIYINPTKTINKCPLLKSFLMQTTAKGWTEEELDDALFGLRHKLVGKRKLRKELKNIRHFVVENEGWERLPRFRFLSPQIVFGLPDNVPKACWLFPFLPFTKGKEVPILDGIAQVWKELKEQEREGGMICKDSAKALIDLLL
uniref:Uncharacterized protein n=1 Tax=Chromera velia CCMP2878 TaxID=1169474 RepID=A0A0G4GUQ5_9ALVE|eukprot:Cvel_23386.t1-p1 / transcript=Cvel_23386.t1 / gene=Cvel_23386 / organism=Chromera_velia_CCMP2878 / gene_product=hypothetical protein / transcript_product=hypothetical protein / location=Cvel_scaffold2404:3217-3891(-) / protein_length=225 / sequence_SO=supercontig / SO=protein_coding / is_pseudo=false